MKVIAVLFLCAWFNVSGQTTQVKIPLEVLSDKIKGGWAGQTIGVSLGAPYEFRYNGKFIPPGFPHEIRLAA